METQVEEAPKPTPRKPRTGLYDFFVGEGSHLLHLVHSADVNILGEVYHFKECKASAILIKELSEEENHLITELELELFKLWGESMEDYGDDDEDDNL
jgi:hypothetical protein